MAKNKDNLNVDQADKSNNGKLNNIENTRFFSEEWADGVHKIFFDPEVTTLSHKSIMCGLVEQEFHAKMDQVLLLYLEEKHIVLVIHLDGTTTFRGERVSTKANEGVVIMRTRKHMENLICVRYPHLSDCYFIHICGVLLPDSLSDKLQKKEKEEFDVDRFCVDVNYKVRGKYITTDDKDGMDFACRKTDLAKALNDIWDNQDEYIFDKNMVAYAWIRLHANDYKDMPVLELNELSAFMRRDHLIYDLQNFSHKYTQTKDGCREDYLSLFLALRNIPFKKKAVAQEKVQILVDYLLTHYPPQKSASMVDIVRADFYGLVPEKEFLKEDIVEGIFWKVVMSDESDRSKPVLMKRLLDYPLEIEQNILEWINNKSLTEVDCHGESIVKWLECFNLTYEAIPLIIKAFISYKESRWRVCPSNYIIGAGAMYDGMAANYEPYVKQNVNAEETKYTMDNLMDGLDEKIKEYVYEDSSVFDNADELVDMFKQVFINCPVEVKNNLLEWLNNQPISDIPCCGTSLVHILRALQLPQEAVFDLALGFSLSAMTGRQSDIWSTAVSWKQQYNKY